MANIVASVITDKASTILQDISAARWSAADLLAYLNDGIREIAVGVDGSYTITGNLTLVAGTKQALPAGAIDLKRTHRNMGVGGSTPGTTVRMVTLQLMDDNRPGWHTDASTLIVKNVMRDPSTPGTFWVYPAQTSANTIEASYSAIPAAITSGTSIPIADDYANALLDYVLYRAYNRDAEVVGMAALSALHKQAFESSLEMNLPPKEPAK